MKKYLVINGLSETGKYSFYGNIAMRWLKFMDSDNTFLISNKGTKIAETLAKYETDTCFSKIIKYSEYFTAPSWSKAIAILEGSDFHSQYDAVLLFSFYENVISIDELNEKIKNDDLFKCNFQHRLGEYRKMYLLDYLSKKLVINHFVIDPLEHELPNSKRFFFYKTENMAYHPYLHYALFSNNKAAPKKENLFSETEQDLDKKFDFVFGITSFNYSGVTNWRNKFIKQFVSIDFSGLQVKNFITSPKLKMKNFLDKQSYDELIKQSRCTLVVPSNDIGHFSLIRFIEAVISGCVPLILRQSNYKLAFSEDKELCNIIEEYLIVDTDTLVEKIKKTDNNFVISKILSTKYFQLHQNNSHFMKFIEFSTAMPQSVDMSETR